MEKVSEERLEQAIKCFLFGARPDVGTEQTRQEDAEMASALSELRELRKVMGAVDEHLQVRPSITISHDIVNDEFIATSGACGALGRDAFSALAALVKGGEA